MGLGSFTIIKVIYICQPAYQCVDIDCLQGSRWTFQAERTDGMVSGYLIKPEHTQTLNPFFVLALIPLFDRVIYPQFQRYDFPPNQWTVARNVMVGVCIYFRPGFELVLTDTCY